MDNTGDRNTDVPELNTQLLHAAIRLNTWLLAGVFACVGGLTLFVVTYLSLYRGLPDPGQYLVLLSVFLPGYSVTNAGAWVGLFWGAVIGALLAVVFYRIYARSIAAQVISHTLQGGKERDLQSITLLLDGNYLGLAVGAVVALGLLVTTNWLVLRGTANVSNNALLLANYLPGYDVSVMGSLIGALEVFSACYMLCLLFSFIYNSIVALRGK